MTIQISSHSKLDLKIGVSHKTSFNLKTSFTDYNFGWGINCADGTLTHHEQIIKTGLKIKQSSIVNVTLDMGAGTLSFSADGVQSD